MIPYHSYVDEQSAAPPTEVRVERVLQRGLVISWTLPKITALGENNGLKIQGYQIFIDDILNSTVLGCYQSKVLRKRKIVFTMTLLHIGIDWQHQC